MSEPPLSFSDQLAKEKFKALQFDVFDQRSNLEIQGAWCDEFTRIRVTITSSNAGIISARIIYRMMYTNGDIKDNQVFVTPTTDRAVNQFLITPGTGWILAINCFQLGGNRSRGSTYCQAFLRNEKTGLGNFILFSGYLTTRTFPAWPNGVNEHSKSGMGIIRSIAGTDPAAGAIVLETVPTSALWKLRGLIAILTTDATVADRRVSVLIDDGVTVLYRFATAQVQGATLVTRYVISPVPLDPGSVSGNIWIPIPPDLLLLEDFRIRLTTENFQAADDWGAPQLMIEEWLQED